MSRSEKSWKRIASTVYEKCNTDDGDVDAKKNGIRKLSDFLNNYSKIILGDKVDIFSLADNEFDEIKEEILDAVQEQGWDRIQDCLTLNKWEHLYRIKEQNYKNQLEFFRSMGDIMVKIYQYSLSNTGQ